MRPFFRTFPQEGALQLDRDVRGLVNFFTNAATFSVRSIFARVNQICTVLTLDELDDIHHYWGGNVGRLKWRLQADEARQLLGLRIDFDADSVKNLVL